MLIVLERLCHIRSLGPVLAQQYPFSVRLPGDILARLHKVAEAVSARSHGIRVTRSTALAIALDRGLESFEKEFGIDPEASSQKPAADAATAWRSGA